MASELETETSEKKLENYDKFSNWACNLRESSI